MKVRKESARTILKRITDGAERAAKLYDKATGSLLSDACEYVLTMGVFERLAQSTNGPVLLEVPVKWARQEASAVRKGRPSKADRLSGRYDLVQYWANNNPRIAIEVKSPVANAYKGRFDADFKRLANTLTASGDSSFQFCCLVLYATKSYPRKAADAIEKRSRAKVALTTMLDKIEGQAAGYVEHRDHKLIRRMYRGKLHYSGDLDEGVWQIAVVVFAHQNQAGTFTSKLMD